MGLKIVLEQSLLKDSIATVLLPMVCRLEMTSVTLCQLQSHSFYYTIPLQIFEASNVSILHLYGNCQWISVIQTHMHHGNPPKNTHHHPCSHHPMHTQFKSTLISLQWNTQQLCWEINEMVGGSWIILIVIGNGIISTCLLANKVFSITGGKKDLLLNSHEYTAERCNLSLNPWLWHW